MRITLPVFIIFLLLTPSFSTAQTNSEPDESILWKISYEGNQQFPGFILSSAIASESPSFFRKLFGRTSRFFYDETELRRDRIRLERFYQRRGFHQVQIRVETEPTRRAHRKKVTFFIDEGIPLRITESSIVIEADSLEMKTITSQRDYQRALERHSFRTGERYQPVMEPEVIGRFNRIMEDSGHPWPETEILVESDSLANESRLTLLLRPGVKSYFTHFNVEGHESVRREVVTRQTGISSGETYSFRAMQSAQRSLFNHHLYRFATINLPEQEKDSTLTVNIRVREYPLRTIEASAGAGTEEILRAQLAWRHRNVNGTGHRFGTFVRASFIEQRANVNYLVPYFFNARSSTVTTAFGLHRLEPSFELLQAGLNSTLIYQIRRNQTTSLSYEYSFNEELSRNRQAALPDSVLNYNISSLTLSGFFSEGFLRDQNGWSIQPSVEFSSTFGEADFTFQKVNLDVRRAISVNRYLAIAGRVNAGTIFYRGSRDLPSNIRYFNGGTNSVRGWGRQQLGPAEPRFDSEGEFRRYVPKGGRSMVSFNLEIRKQLTREDPVFGVAAFFDGGQVWSATPDLSERPLQFAAGAGISYQSPIGPIRLDVGYKLNPDDADLNIYDGVNYGTPRNRYGIHLSIGQSF
ncbi:MAG: hypothetical protein EA360_03610 [Balneolaceae bacterium]|nr:MAG: hypothetical protein EA360_03610 [Balneolaceae bacterium]